MACRPLHGPQVAKHNPDRPFEGRLSVVMSKGGAVPLSATESAPERTLDEANQESTQPKLHSLFSSFSGRKEPRFVHEAGGDDDFDLLPVDTRFHAVDWDWCRASFLDAEPDPVGVQQYHKEPKRNSDIRADSFELLVYQLWSASLAAVESWCQRGFHQREGRGYSARAKQQ